jgi:hypothetical protein
MCGLLNLLSSLLQDVIVFAAIGYPEAKTYATDHNARIGILFMMIALSGLIIMIGFRIKQQQNEKTAKASPV